MKKIVLVIAFLSFLLFGHSLELKLYSNDTNVVTKNSKWTECTSNSDCGDQCTCFKHGGGGHCGADDQIERYIAGCPCFGADNSCSRIGDTCVPLEFKGNTYNVCDGCVARSFDFIFKNCARCSGSDIHSSSCTTKFCPRDNWSGTSVHWDGCGCACCNGGTPTCGTSSSCTCVSDNRPDGDDDDVVDDDDDDVVVDDDDDDDGSGSDIHDGGSDRSVCFPANALVMLESNVMKRMKDLEIGDKVQVSKGKFSEVFAFTHRDKNVRHNFIELTLSDGRKIELTESHYIYVNGQLKTASCINVGDVLTDIEESNPTVIEKSNVENVGLYNPQTVHGDIVVNGIVASTYSSALPATIAHSSLSPVRLLFSATGKSLKFLESISESLNWKKSEGCVVN